jgi:hypothetical protein
MGPEIGGWSLGANMKKIMVLALTVFCLNSFAEEKKEIALKDGFKGIKLGMVKEQVDKAVLEDESFKKDAEGKMSEVSVGDYAAKPVFEYNSKGLLCSITLNFTPVESYGISSTIQKQADYFFEVFQKKYGRPAYKKSKEFSDSISNADFKENEISHYYDWVNNAVTRSVSLAWDSTGFYIVITITDNVLQEKAKKDNKIKDDKQKKKDDF